MNGGTLIGIGAISGFIGVAAGAFGAHALKARLPPDMLAVFEVGVRYQMYHALVMMLAGVLALSRPSGMLNAAGLAMLAGTVVFSGSLYVLAMTGVRWLGAITPIGGVAFLVGWVLLAIVAFRI
jgi:uncharacterized membrane protein YgdD (TMEM256/DUF423 family)